MARDLNCARSHGDGHRHRHHGPRHRPGVRAGRADDADVRRARGRGGRGARRHQQGPRRPGDQGPHDRGGESRRHRASEADRLARRGGGVRRRDRGHRREARGQARTVPRTGKASGARRGDRHQHLFAVGDRNRRRLRQAGARRRPAFLQSAADHAAGRGDRRPAHRSRGGRGAGRLFAPDQEASGGRHRHARLRGQSRRPRLWAGSAAHRGAGHRVAARSRSA